MRLRRRDFLKGSSAAAAASWLPASLSLAAANARAYPYLGRTEDYVDFQIIEPGLIITKGRRFTAPRCGSRKERSKSRMVPAGA